MEVLHIVTPVKDAIDLTLKTIEAVQASRLNMPHDYTVYNDFSTPENTAILEKAALQMGFNLVNLADVTTNPSPNYLLVLRRERERALSHKAAMVLVESDVIVEPDTLQALWDGASERPDCGIAAAVTVDEQGTINYPYTFAAGSSAPVMDLKRHCSFCCSLLTPRLLETVDFNLLDENKHWFDVTISRAALRNGLHNYLFTSLPVVHYPHSSRPWKHLKHTNPLKYYWNKIVHGFDKI